MNDPKNTETTNEELGLEQLEDAAGGLCFEDRAEFGVDYDGNDFCAMPKHNVSSTSGPGGTSYPKENVGGSAGPGGTSFPKSEIAVGPDSDFCPNSG